jgi:hypothetical protein
LFFSINWRVVETLQGQKEDVFGVGKRIRLAGGEDGEDEEKGEHGMNKQS